MTTIDVKLNITDEVLSYLQSEAKNRNLPLDQIISDLLLDYFDDPTDEEILAGLKRSMQQVLAGEYLPARQFLDEIEHEAINNADNS